MGTNPDLFEVIHVPSEPKPPVRWQLVTNQRNLFYMIAAGLIMPPKGFGKKYYQDTLSAFPGWVPLFAETVPKAAIEWSVSEKSHLLPCLATVDLSHMRGTVMAVGSDGELKEIAFPEGLDGTERFLFVPAPLPINWIASIGFRSREDKVACETDVRDFANVPLLDFKREVTARVFAQSSDWTWPPADLGLANIDTTMDVPLAAGAMMAMLLHVGNLGDIGMRASRLALDSEVGIAESISDPMISALGAWLQTGHLPESSDVSKNLFWGIVDKVVACRSSAIPVIAQDVALAHLESSSETLDERMKPALYKLAGDLRTVAGFTDSTVTEIFERHPKPFSRVMMLFFLREKCADLLEFKHPLLTEPDYVAAAILFAAREGWLGLPIQLRDVPGLQPAVSHRMAALAHRMGETCIDLGSPPPRPLPLRELFAPASKTWGSTQKDAALVLARESKWDCIQTRVNLGKGNYRLVVDGTGVNIIFDGEAKAVATEVDQDRFFFLLAQTPISSKLSRKVRDVFKV